MRNTNRSRACWWLRLGLLAILLFCARNSTAGQPPAARRPHSEAAEKEAKSNGVSAIAQRKPVDLIGPKIDQFVKQAMAAVHIPGVSLVVIKDGKVIKQGAYGLANIDLNVAVKPETVFLLASITKVFTATGIMMLVEDGKVNLDEKISRYLPDTPEAWKAITVRHLLTHTAGLKDRFEGRSVGEWLLNFTTEQMYDSARKQPLDFKPGERWQYSDQGFFLLGMIIEKVTGKTYRQFLQERILRPCGMTATTTISQTEIIPNLASGYTQLNGTLYHNHRRTDYGLVSHFGVVTNVIDMAKFDAALNGGRLLKPATIAQMCAAATLENGSKVRVSGLTSYGFGWFLSDFFGHHIVQHGGSTGTAYYRVPSDGLSIIVLTNLEQAAGGDATGMAKAISAMVLPALSWSAQKPRPDPDPKFSQVLKAELERIADAKPDVSLYTPEFARIVTASVPSSKGFYTSIGQLKALSYLGGQTEGANHILFYRADHPGAQLFYTVILTDDGKIASLTGEPETQP